MKRSGKEVEELKARIVSLKEEAIQEEWRKEEEIKKWQALERILRSESIRLIHENDRLRNTVEALEWALRMAQITCRDAQIQAREGKLNLEQTNAREELRLAT